MSSTQNRNKVRRNPLWVHPVLEDLSVRLSSKSVDARTSLSRSNRLALVRTCDYAVALHNCSQDLDIGWTVFWAKYMNDSVSRGALLQDATRQLAQANGDCKRAALAAHFALRYYCDGVALSGRHAERTLKLCRKRTWPKLRSDLLRVVHGYWRYEEQLGERLRPLLR